MPTCCKRCRRNSLRKIWNVVIVVPDVAQGQALCPIHLKPLVTRSFGGGRTDARGYCLHCLLECKSAVALLTVSIAVTRAISVIEWSWHRRTAQ